MRLLYPVLVVCFAGLVAAAVLVWKRILPVPFIKNTKTTSPSVSPTFPTPPTSPSPSSPPPDASRDKKNDPNDDTDDNTFNSTLMAVLVIVIVLLLGAAFYLSRTTKKRNRQNITNNETADETAPTDSSSSFINRMESNLRYMMGRADLPPDLDSTDASIIKVYGKAGSVMDPVLVSYLEQQFSNEYGSKDELFARNMSVEEMFVFIHERLENTKLYFAASEKTETVSNMLWLSGMCEQLLLSSIEIKVDPLGHHLQAVKKNRVNLELATRLLIFIENFKKNQEVLSDSEATEDEKEEARKNIVQITEDTRSIRENAEFAMDKSNPVEERRQRFENAYNTVTAGVEKTLSTMKESGKYVGPIVLESSANAISAVASTSLEYTKRGTSFVARKALNSFYNAFIKPKEQEESSRAKKKEMIKQLSFLGPLFESTLKPSKFKELQKKIFRRDDFKYDPRGQEYPYATHPSEVVEYAEGAIREPFGRAREIIEQFDRPATRAIWLQKKRVVKHLQFLSPMYQASKKNLDPYKSHVLLFRRIRNKVVTHGGIAYNEIGEVVPYPAKPFSYGSATSLGKDPVSLYEPR
jgi:hypothetical protein